MLRKDKLLEASNPALSRIAAGPRYRGTPSRSPAPRERTDQVFIELTRIFIVESSSSDIVPLMSINLKQQITFTQCKIMTPRAPAVSQYPIGTDCTNMCLQDVPCARGQGTGSFKKKMGKD